jgi:hypothetical protein
MKQVKRSGFFELKREAREEAVDAMAPSKN